MRVQIKGEWHDLTAHGITIDVSDEGSDDSDNHILIRPTDRPDRDRSIEVRGAWSSLRIHPVVTNHIDVELL